MTNDEHKLNVDLLSKEHFNIALMNAVAETVGNDGDILEHFGIVPNGGALVDVQVLVNGKPVPFVKELGEALKKMLNCYDGYVKEAALELICRDRRLMHIHNELENADWAVKQIIEDLYEIQNDPTKKVTAHDE